MSFKRQYLLPNCTLILEGFSEDVAPDQNGQGVLSILVNAECQFLGSAQKISGGRTFLENLVKVVNAYAQKFLSGLDHPVETSSESDLIFLESVNNVDAQELHRLVWQADPAKEEDKIEINLTTVQLFDLVEAIDQFLADSLTLPDISLELHPISRRYRQAEETLVEQATPATLGVAGLALAAIAFFFIPVPQEIKNPNEEPKPMETPAQTEDSIPSDSSP